MRSNATLSVITGNLNENDIEVFLETVGSFKKYTNVKAPAQHFNFETYCSQFIQPSIILLEDLFGAVSFDIVTGATNKSINGKHWTLL